MIRAISLFETTVLNALNVGKFDLSMETPFVDTLWVLLEQRLQLNRNGLLAVI